MTCKQEFLVLEKWWVSFAMPRRTFFSILACASFILHGPLLIPANPSSNKRSLYLLAACLSSASLVFASLQLDARWVRACSRAISDSRPLLSARERRGVQRHIARERRDWLLYNVFSECSRLTSEFPISPGSRFWRGSTRDVFAHLIRHGSSSHLAVKENC